MKKKEVVFFIVLVAALFSLPASAWAVNGEAELEQQMLNLVNSERAQSGLEPLRMDSKLVELARLKSQDMIDKNYFSHTSPTYGDPFTMMKNQGVGYWLAGENLAGNPSLTGAHEALMNSPGHRANILKPEFTHIGIGVVKGGPYGMMVTQMFIKSRGETPPGEPEVKKPNDLGSNNSLESKNNTQDQTVKNTEKSGEDLTIVFKDKEVEFPDKKPYINEQNRIMVPLRFVSQQMGYEVDWEMADQKIIIHNQESMMNLWVGKSILFKNNKILISDSKPELVEGRTLIPLRLVSEMLGCEVEWYPTLHKVTIK